MCCHVLPLAPSERQCFVRLLPLITDKNRILCWILIFSSNFEFLDGANKHLEMSDRIANSFVVKQSFRAFIPWGGVVGFVCFHLRLSFLKSSFTSPVFFTLKYEIPNLSRNWILNGCQLSKFPPSSRSRLRFWSRYLEVWLSRPTADRSFSAFWRLYTGVTLLSRAFRYGFHQNLWTFLL